MTESSLQLVKTAANRLCELGAMAVQRYAKKSGLDVNEYLPESFIQSYMLDHYDEATTITTETKLKDMTKSYPEKYNPRIDLVLYQENRQPFALIEIKSGFRIVDRDRAKLKKALPFIESHPVGILCTQCRVEDQLPKALAQYERHKLETDIWIESPPFEASNRMWVYGAHVFGIAA
jgi:hypothetical protein